MLLLLLLLLSLAATLSANKAAALGLRRDGDGKDASANADGRRPQPDPRAETRWLRVPLDHSRPSERDAFNVRYVVSPWTGREPPRAVWFYAGNEAPVDHYVKSCGLMWETRSAFRAVVVFAEHRFWGLSVPAKLDYSKMGPDQAIEDFRAVLDVVNPNQTLPVVAFGGSYGGMLAAWMRLKYPNYVAAAVASSAPVLAFPPPPPSQASSEASSTHAKSFYDDFGASYWRVVSRGHFAPCARKIFATLVEEDLTSPDALDALGVCANDAASATRSYEEVVSWIAFAMENLAMGDFSFASDYMGFELPANPAQVACTQLLREGGGLAGLRAAIDVWYNATKTTQCYRIPPRFDADFYDGLWDRMWCQFLVPQETYFARRGWPNDMFPRADIGWDDVDAHCSATWGVTPDRYAIRRFFGATTEDEWRAKASRIVFSNGRLDPWSAGGVLDGGPDLPVVRIPSGAHHADLFFSHPDDPFDLTAARARIVAHLAKWLGFPRLRVGGGSGSGAPVVVVAEVS